MKKKNILLSLMLIASLAACNKDNQTSPSQEAETSTNQEAQMDTSQDQTDGLEKYSTTIYDYFDTVTSFIAYTETEGEYNEYRQVLEDSLRTYHQLFNGYYDFEGVNNIKTINENAGNKPVEVDPALIELLEYSKEVYGITDGKINIALGSLLDLWHHYREEALDNPDDPSKAIIPSQEELVEASAHKDIDAIEIDKEKNTVYISQPQVQIEVGAIGKGYAIKKIVEDLKEAGLSHGMLSIGGDDVLIGNNPSREDGLWRIAIQNPDLTSQDQYSSIVGLENTTVVTSGDYQRFYKVDGEIYHHIIDPDTMFPSKYFRSVSVVHSDIALADSLSTYFFLVDLEKGMEVAEKYGAAVLWIDHEGKQTKTPNWSKMEN